MHNRPSARVRLEHSGSTTARNLRLLRLVVLIVEDMSFGEHALMKNARNHDAFTFLPVKHDVLAMLMTAQTGANVITKSA